MRPRWPLKRFLLILTLLAGLGAAAAWGVLLRWLPVQGKAWLEERIEAALPVDAAIGSLRYTPGRGVMLESLAITDPARGTVWVAAPSLRARIGWASFLLGRIAVRLQGAVTAPLDTELALTVRSDLRGRSVTVMLRTADAPLASVIPEFRAALPPGLREGQVRAQLRLHRVPDRPAQLTGTLALTQLVWELDGRRGTANATMDGTVVFTLPQPMVDVRIAVQHGVLEGWPAIGRIDAVDGRLRLVNDVLTIERLSAQALDTEWTVEGRVTPVMHPSLEVLVTARLPLQAAFRLWAGAGAAWRADGTADVRAVCRGPLAPAWLDCQADARLRDGRLETPMLREALTAVSGHAHVDIPARRLRIDELMARAGGGRIRLDGEALLRQPAMLDMTVEADIPVDLLQPWLAERGWATAVAGDAGIALHLTGQAATPRTDGEVTLRDVAAESAHLPAPVRALTGRLRLDPDGVEGQDVRVTLRDHPLTVTFRLNRTTPPSLTALVAFSGGLLEFRGQLPQDDLVVDDAHLTLSHTDVRATGSWPRVAQRPAVLHARGTVELSELAAVPLLDWPVLASWHPHGQVSGEASFNGFPADWRAAAIHSRITTSALQLGQVPIDEGLMELDQRARRLRVTLAGARMAGGLVRSDLQVDYGTTPQTNQYALQLEATTVQLNQLAERIPAWRELGVSGEASANAQLSGVWADRPTWIGEGWINASGEQLGSMPLLDKVFRGLFGLLGDRLGLDSLRRAQITSASARWRLQHERIVTENLRLAGYAGGAPVAVYATGSVGLDRTLDFVIEPEFTEQLMLEAPNTSSLASIALRAAGQLDRFRRLIGRHRLTGTLQEPDYRFEFSPSEAVRQVAPAPADFLQGVLDSLR